LLKLIKELWRVVLTKLSVSFWQNQEGFYCKDYHGDGNELRKVTGTKNVAQFMGGKVILTESLW